MTPPTLPNRLWPFSFHFYRQFRRGVLGLVVFPVLSRGVFASIAYATKRLTDTVLAMRDPAHEAGKVLGPFAFFVGLVVARFAMDAGAWFSSYNTRSPMLRRIKQEVFAYTQRLSSSYFENTLSGKIAHRAIMLPEQVLQLFDMVVFDFLPGTAFFAFVALFFYLASPAFFAAAVVAIVTYFSVSLLVGRECTRRAIASNEAKAAVTGRMVDVLTNIRNVFFFANQELEDEQLQQYTGAEFERRRASYRAVVRLRSVQYVMDISMWIVFVGGALYAWLHGRIGAGDFVMTTALTSSLLQTAYNLGQRIPEFYDLVGSARESIDTLIVPATITDIPGAPAINVTQGSIHVDRIAFAYELPSLDKLRRVRNVVKDFELTISAGQRVGLLDEATSALDSHSEQIIQSAMREAMVGKTVIAIAHRLSTVMDMDRLIVLDRGRIVADGSHRELLSQGGLYAELWQKQSGGFNPVTRPAIASDQGLELGVLDEQARDL